MQAESIEQWPKTQKTYEAFGRNESMACRAGGSMGLDAP
jgi:hypothetical protein